MPAPLVSVVVPAYNQSQYLRACLDSLWFQDYPRLEIIVVNDGAGDDTPRVIEAYTRDIETRQTSYASRYNPATGALERTWHPVYPRDGRTFRVIDHEHNKGLAATLNTGLAACHGQYCTYVPGDNLAYPHMISVLVAALGADAAAFAYADMHIVNDAMQILRHFKLPDYSFEACFADWYLCGVCKLYDRTLHDRFGYYDPALLAHDHALYQRFAMGGTRFTHANQALMAVRDHEAARQIDIHAPHNWDRLLRESMALVVEARQWLARTTKAPA